MTKVKSFADLKAMRESLIPALSLREKANNPESFVQVKVAMDTCGIAAGAKQIMEFMLNKAEELNIDALFTQTDCMGYCDAEPTVEVILPNEKPVIFGNVNNERAEEILVKYIQRKEAVEGVVEGKIANVKK